MLVSEIITTVLVVAVGLFTTAALYIGIVGMLGGVYLARCPSCRHLGFSVADAPPGCLRCRHPIVHQALPFGHTRRGLAVERIHRAG